MLKVAEFIDTVLTKKDDATIARVKADVREAGRAVPVVRGAPPVRAGLETVFHAMNTIKRPGGIFKSNRFVETPYEAIRRKSGRVQIGNREPLVDIKKKRGPMS